MGILESSAFVDRSAIKSHAIDNRQTIDWDSSVSERTGTVGSISLVDDTVKYVFITLEYQLRLQELVEEYGEPSGYFSYVFLTPHGPQCPSYEVEFVWPEHGLAASQYFQLPEWVNQQESTLTADMLYVDRAYYFSPGIDPLAYLAALGLGEQDGRDRMRNYFHEWEGYESIALP